MSTLPINNTRCVATLKEALEEELRLLYESKEIPSIMINSVPKLRNTKEHYSETLRHKRRSKSYGTQPLVKGKGKDEGTNLMGHTVSL